VAEVHRLVKVYDGVGYSVGRALGYAETGVAVLSRLPGSEAREILSLIAEYVIQRDR
jgi:geranylgeranyl pyrophosphate synthase